MYSIEISDKNGCLSISEDFEIIIAGINNANQLNDIRNYLDSTNGELNLTNLPNELILIQVPHWVNFSYARKRLNKKNSLTYGI
jgi:hypothetical protein